MRKLTFAFVAVLITLLLFAKTNAQQKEESNVLSAFVSAFKDITLSGQWFLSYQSGRKNGVTDNEFLLKRGYITFQKKFNERFSARITQDVSVDRQGDGEGDIEIRLKYGFLRYQFGSSQFFHKPQIEFGLVARPWLDFEQSINQYRVQGTMFLERNGILSSADYGVTFVTLLGGEVDKEYQEKVNKNMPGKYGSISFGVYNGGGYHAVEKNENKMIDGRISLRPLPAIIPGLQFSYIGTYGKGNVESSPEFFVNAGFASFESAPLVLTAMYYRGKGFEDGGKLNPRGESVNNSGYSFFADFRIPEIPVTLFGRYDYFNTEQEPVASNSKRFITGIAYHIPEGSKIVIDYDRVKRSNFPAKDDYLFEVVVEFRY